MWAQRPQIKTRVRNIYINCAQIVWCIMSGYSTFQNRKMKNMTNLIIRPISSHENFPWIENFPKISVVKNTTLCRPCNHIFPQIFGRFCGKFSWVEMGHSRKISTDRKFSENIIVKSWKFSTSKFFSDGKFVSTNHISQNFLSAENFPEWKWALTRD